jgi:hypothetical protein
MGSGARTVTVRRFAADTTVTVESSSAAIEPEKLA